MTTPANLYPGLNDIQDTLEQYPIETSKYITLLHEIDAKCVNLVPELNRRIDSFLSNENVSRDSTPPLEFQRLKVLELAQINALFEELMPSLEEKMHVSSIMLETLERISSRLDLAYEVALRNEEIPEKLRLGVDNHPAMHLHRELMERIEQGGHGKHGNHNNNNSNNNNNSAHASSSNTNAAGTAVTTTTTSGSSGTGVTGSGSGATEGKSSQALKSESRREAMAANKRAQQQAQFSTYHGQRQQQQQQQQQGQNKHNETSLERSSSRKRSNNTGNGTSEVSDTTKKRRKKNGNGNNGTAAATSVTSAGGTNASNSTVNVKGNSSNNNTAKSEETTTHGKQRTNEYGEPLYCYCNQVAYGEMVGCDGENCELEWFHLPCIGLETLPKGKWYCRSCKKKLKS